MVVILHVAAALLSIVIATLSFFKPSKLMFRSIYMLIAVTLGSGIYLAWAMPAKMLHVCISGIIYTVVVTALTLLAHARFVELQKGEQS